MQLTPAELHAQAPLGSLVTYSDGTKEPPARHKNKLNQWKSRNGSDLLTEINPGNPAKEYDKPSFTLTTDHGWLVINQHTSLKDDGVRYEFTPPEPGSILACSERGGKLALKHKWRDEQDMRLWERSKGYDVTKQQWKLFIIAENGERQDYTIPVMA